MKKEQLTALGITEEIAEKVVNLHKDEMKEYVPKHRFDEVNTAKTTLNDQLKEANTQLEKLKKFEGTNEELKAKIDKYQQDFLAKEEEHKSAMNILAKQNLIKVSLLAMENRPYDVDIVAKLIDEKLVQLDANSEKIVSGLSEQVENIRKEKAFLFSVGAGKPQPSGKEPAGGGDPNNNDTAKSWGERLAQSKLKSLGISDKKGDK